LILLGSCKAKQIKCNSFNFEHVPYDSSYYTKSLKYESENDTLDLQVETINSSRESVWGSFGYECDPYFAISYSDRSNNFSVLFEFNYCDMENCNESDYLIIIINSSKIELNLDKARNRLNQELIIDEIDQLGNDIGRKISRIKLQKMRITEIETYTGRIWRLIQK
jgi:hypothetical protein